MRRVEPLLALLLALSCASEEGARGPSPEEVCSAEVGDLQAYVARVAGSRGAWAWRPAGALVVREGDSFPTDDGAGRLGIEVAADGQVRTSTGDAAATVAEALAAAADARLALAFAPDVTMARVRETLAAARNAAVTELDLAFEQYKPTGPPEASGARPLVARLSDCEDCGALRAQLRTRIAGGCLPLADALWTDDVDDSVPFDERVAAARAWAGRLAAGMEECTCEGVDIPALWDVVWQRLAEPRPLTAVPLVLAGEPPKNKRRRGKKAAAEEPRVRTIALPDDVVWRDAHAAFVEAAPFAVRVERAN